MPTKKQVKTKRPTPAKRSGLKSHVVASLLSTASHAHTGKKVQHRHTSHGFLLLALILTGALLFSNLSVLQAYGITRAGSVNVSVNVYGTAPTVGATITFPTTNSQTTYQFVDVTGTCPDQTLVVVYRNGLSAGSAVCTGGTFSITTQLLEGVNTLQAQNYDGMNQAGPTTSQVIVEYLAPIVPVEPTPNPTTPPPTPIATTDKQVKPVSKPIKVSSTPDPAENPCFDLDDSKKIVSDSPVISVGCIHRNVFVGETLSLPVMIQGGFVPYALSVEWGDGEDDLVAIVDNKKRILQHVYSTGGFREIKLRTTDSSGASAIIQTVVSVNGNAAGAPVSRIDKVVENAKSVWIDAPVPLYIAAVTLALGFWVGDIFQRFTTSNTRRTPHKRTRRA